MTTGNQFSFQLGKHQRQVEARLEQLNAQNFVQRLWNKDITLWKRENGETELPLGWLDVVDKMISAVPAINSFRDEIVAAGFSHVVLLGMGGSSLAPYVLQKTFRAGNGLKLHMLDSTDPETVTKTENSIDVANTLFIVASKSGNTAEVMAFFHYFYNKVSDLKGDRTGENFISITDEGSPLTNLSAEKNFRKVFINFSDIGGRFSALSYFGMVPAALAGINIEQFLKRTKTMMDECGPDVPASKNPGVILGAAIAEMALKGCDKLTYLLPAELSTFGLWLEQLIAESTGKGGKGILPLCGDPLIDIDTYGKDRCFFSFEFVDEPDYLLNQKLKDFTFLNYPLIHIQIRDVMDLGREFFRWEIATAVAGAILDMNPFDQPNVEESKKCCKKYLAWIAKEGKLPEIPTSLMDGDMKYHGVPAYETSKKLMEAFFGTPKPGDYIGVQAYLPESPALEKLLTEIRVTLQKNLHVAVSTQFGPRYLHSTGQYHKGGPSNGSFIQFVSSASKDVEIPGEVYTFGALKSSQAMGDMEALKKHNRNVVMINVGHDPVAGLQQFIRMIKTLEFSRKQASESSGNREHNPTAA